MSRISAEPQQSFDADLVRKSGPLSSLRSTSFSRSRDLEAQLAEPLGSWKLQDIDWTFVLGAQHYGTAMVTLFILIALVIVHYTLDATERPFFLYDAAISYVSNGDTVPAWAAVVVPLVCLLISLVAYEFFIYRSFNHHITNAMATAIHFFMDCVCAFIAVEFVTELTKFLAGRLRPDFLQDCGPTIPITGTAELGSSVVHKITCTINNLDGRKSFPSGHSSCSSSIMTYNIVYLLWAGYIRAEGSSFMGLQRQTGWRGGRRFLRELGHGVYLFWILCQLAFVWAVGVSRFNDNKHNISDVLGGWLLGMTFSLIYSVRASTLHQYIVLHNVLNRRGEPGR